MGSLLHSISVRPPASQQEVAISVFRILNSASVSAHQSRGRLHPSMRRRESFDCVPAGGEKYARPHIIS